MHGAWLHIMGDALGSVGAIIAGVLMSLYGWYQADALFSAGIAPLDHLEFVASHQGIDQRAVEGRPRISISLR
jgi:Co/Zn/Cd efflux system component